MASALLSNAFKGARFNLARQVQHLFIPMGTTPITFPQIHRLHHTNKQSPELTEGTTEININTTHSGDPAPTLHGTFAGITSTLHQTIANTFHDVQIASAANPNCDATHGSSLRSLLIFGSTAFRNTKQTLFGKKYELVPNHLACVCSFGRTIRITYSLPGITQLSPSLFFPNVPRVHTKYHTLWPL